MAKKIAADAEKVEVKTRRDLRNWLSKNFERNRGIWLVSYKKHTNHYLPYDDIVEECLCFGWVDSLPRKLDGDRTMLYLAPRKSGSNWSKANKERAKRLITEGLMNEAGLVKINAAKKDGSWDFLVDVGKGVLPDDLEELLSANPKAKRNFNKFPPSSKRGILEWIKNAKKPETRAKRVRETAEKAAENKKANHYRQ